MYSQCILQVLSLPWVRQHWGNSVHFILIGGCPKVMGIYTPELTKTNVPTEKSVTFTCDARGAAPLKYQWMCDGQTTTVDMWDGAFWNIIAEWLSPRSGCQLFWIIWRRWSRAYQLWYSELDFGANTTVDMWDRAFWNIIYVCAMMNAIYLALEGEPPVKWSCKAAVEDVIMLSTDMRIKTRLKKVVSSRGKSQCSCCCVESRS